MNILSSCNGKTKSCKGLFPKQPLDDFVSQAFPDFVASMPWHSFFITSLRTVLDVMPLTIACTVASRFCQHLDELRVFHYIKKLFLNDAKVANKL